MGIKKPCSQSHFTHPGHGGTCLIQLPQRWLLCCRCDVWISQGVPERDPKAQISLERTETEEVPCRARAQIPVLSQKVAGTATTNSCHTTSSHLAPLWVEWGLHREMVMGSLVAQGHGPVLAAERQGSTQATRGKGNGYQGEHVRIVLVPVTFMCSAQTPAMPKEEPTRRAVTAGPAARAISSHQLCCLCTLLPVLQAHALSFLHSNKSNPSSLHPLCQTFSSSTAVPA